MIHLEPRRFNHAKGGMDLKFIRRYAYLHVGNLEVSFVGLGIFTRRVLKNCSVRAEWEGMTIKNTYKKVQKKEKQVAVKGRH